MRRRSTIQRAEFDRLYREAARRLWIVASAHAPRDAVEDVLQESAVIAWRKRAEYEVGTAFDAWISAIVRRVAARASARPRLSNWVDDEGEHPVVVHSQGAFDDDLAGALRALSGHERECILLHHVLGLTHGEVGRLLGIKEGTVASHLHRGRVELRRRMEKNTVRERSRS
ncbi:MAG: RNA polymerase sigma factor [Planctomycetota bacterium]